MFFGEMGLNIRDYADTTPFLFFEYKLPGHESFKRSNKVELRRLGELLIMPHIDKNKSFDILNYWPIAGDSEMISSAPNLFTDEQMNDMVSNVERKKKERMLKRQQKEEQENGFNGTVTG